MAHEEAVRPMTASTAASTARRPSDSGTGSGASSDFKSTVRGLETRRMEEARAKLADEGDSDKGTAAERDMAHRGLSPTYDPNPSAPSSHARLGELRRGPGAAGTAALDFTDMWRFLTTPTPRGAGVVQCYIERDKSGLGKRVYPLYQLYMKDGDRFLLAGKKRPKQKTSNYLISRSASDLSRDGENFIGKLRSNFLGTEFVAFDNGINPKDAKKRSNVGKSVRHELASVTYVRGRTSGVVFFPCRGASTLIVWLLFGIVSTGVQRVWVSRAPENAGARPQRQLGRRAVKVPAAVGAGGHFTRCRTR